MSRRIYSETVKKWLKRVGITAGTLITGILAFLITLDEVHQVDYSNSTVCAGDDWDSDPCIANISFCVRENPTQNNDIFIMPTDHDPWGRNTTLEFDPAVKDWRFYRSWGDGWREIPLDKGCTGTWCGKSPDDERDEAVFSYAFREGRCYDLQVRALKHDPTETIKWSALEGKIDPYWEGIKTHDFKRKGFDSLDVRKAKDSSFMRLYKWDKEVSLDIEFKDVRSKRPQSHLKKTTGASFSSVADEIYVQDYDDYQIETYETEDGIEYQVNLKTKPESNVLDFDVDSENLSFYHQPALNASGCARDEYCNATHSWKYVNGTKRIISHRPVNVVDSYAVYHNHKRDNEYKTGKVFHIYRPLVRDSNGRETWGSLNYSKGVMRLTISQDFLDKAEYPVEVDPTFGYESVGSSNLYISDIICYLDEAPEDGTVKNITAYIQNNGWNNQSYDYGMYKNSTNSFLGNCGKGDLFNGESFRWKTLSFSNEISITNEIWYRICMWSESFNVVTKYDVLQSNGHPDFKERTSDGTFNSWPSNPTWNEIEYSPEPDYRAFSIYAEYTVSEDDNTPPDSPSNPSPSDGATGVSTDPTLSTDVSDPDGDSMDVTFYDASDDSVIDTDNNVASGGTASVSWNGLSEDTTYDWYAEADDGTDTNTSSTWSFTTEDVNNPPDSPSNPSPSDGATDVSTDPTLSVDVSDPNGDNMDVTFYDSSDDSVIGTDSGVSSGGTASVSWNGLSEDTTYDWYAEADDGEYTNTSDTWSFTTTATPSISISKTYPSLNDVNVTQNEFFKVSLNLTCSDADCGDVNVTLDPISDYNKKKELTVSSESGSPTISQVIPIRLTSGDDSTSGSGDIVLDWTNIADESDIAVYDENDNLLDYWIEDFDATAESAVIHVYDDWVRDGTVQAQILYGDGSSDQSVTSETVFDQEYGLEAALALNEDSGDAIDLTSNSNDATVNGATQGVSGLLDGAYDFSGSTSDNDDNVNFGAPSGWDTYDEGSISAIIEVDNLDSKRQIFAIECSHSYRHWGWFVNTDGKIGVDNRETSNEQEGFFSGETISSNQEHHVVLTSDGSAFYAYIDGTLLSFDGWGYDDGYWWTDLEDSNTLTDYKIGEEFTTPRKAFMDGTIDYFKIHNESISSDDVEAQHDASKATPDFFSQSAGESIGEEEVTKEIIPTGSGIPFYTNKSSNPYTVTSMTIDESRIVDFWVNATGNVSSSWDFFAYANMTSDTSINDQTVTWNVTIVEEAADSCSCPSPAANWEIDLNDDCVIDSDCDNTPYNITFIGIGSITFNASIQACNIGALPAGETGILGNSASVSVGGCS